MLHPPKHGPYLCTGFLPGHMEVLGLQGAPIAAALLTLAGVFSPSWETPDCTLPQVPGEKSQWVFTRWFPAAEFHHGYSSCKYLL